MYAAHSFRLRDDWLGRSEGPAEEGLQRTLAAFGASAGRKNGVLAEVAAKDFLLAITLLYSKECRLSAEKAFPDNKEKWPAVRATRQTLLTLPLHAYQKYRDRVLHGFQQAAKFLRQLYIYRVFDLPYQAQLVPLAAIFADLGNRAEPAPVQQQIERWFWCGVFGELYGAATESRYAKDIMEVPAWIAGGPQPDTVTIGTLNPGRLLRIYTRNSAAYKGINALLMRQGAKDFRTGQTFDATVFFDENVDIHHVFPQAWCKEKNLPKEIWDSVVNKTPLTFRTNRIIGGDAPSKYLAKLQLGSKTDAPIPAAVLDAFLTTHSIPIEAMRADDFDAFIAGRHRQLLELVCQATGQPMPAELSQSVDDIDTEGVGAPMEETTGEDRVHGAATMGEN